MTSGQVSQEEKNLFGGLTAKQEAFCLHYLGCLNASEAARRAGYSTDTAGAIGSENLQKPEIATRIRALRERITPSTDTAIATLNERKALLSEIARHKTEAPVSAGHRIAAARELNLMEDVYKQQNNGPGIVNITYVFQSQVTPVTGSNQPVIESTQSTQSPIIEGQITSPDAPNEAS